MGQNLLARCGSSSHGLNPQENDVQILNDVNKNIHRKKTLTKSQTGSNMSLKDPSKNGHKLRSQKNGTVSGSESKNVQSSMIKHQVKSVKVEKKAKSQLGKERMLHSTQDPTETAQKMSKTNNF